MLSTLCGGGGGCCYCNSSISPSHTCTKEIKIEGIVQILNTFLYRTSLFTVCKKRYGKKEKRIRLRKRDEVFPFFGKENIFYKEISETLFLGNIAPFKNIRRDCAQSKYIRTYVSLHLFSQSIPDMKHFLARSLSLSL